MAQVLMLAGNLTGCRSFPTLDASKYAISVLRDAATAIASVDIDRDLPLNFSETFNRATLFAYAHQCFAIASRAGCDSYVPATRFTKWGLATVVDKDDGSGYRTRLVWADSTVLFHMRIAEQRAAAVRHRLRLPANAERPLFLLSEDLKELEIRPRTVIPVIASFLPFPVNTPRRAMRTLLANCFPEISVTTLATYMGHWQEHIEPWGRHSSFEYADYLEQLRAIIPKILGELGFAVPPEAHWYE